MVSHFKKNGCKLKKGTDKHWFVSSKTGYNLHEPIIEIIRNLKNNSNISITYSNDESGTDLCINDNKDKSTSEIYTELFEQTDILIEKLENSNLHELTSDDYKNIIVILTKCRDSFINFI